ncbi:MAG: amidase [Salinibacter sp.]
MPDPTTLSAPVLARRIRDGRHSAVEVLEAHLARIERRNPSLNAIVTLDADHARARARAADAARDAGTVWGPLHGVPFTVKDQYATAGLRTTYGLPQHPQFVPDTDATLVDRLRRAGGILIGKTNLPFAAYDWQCRHPVFGRTNNPHDPTRTPGGSSGGSAAALAARLTPLELGADVAGSIRVPSHFCGVAGLRPTEGRLPIDRILPPDRPRTVQHVVVGGPMARRVEGLQLAWRALADEAPAAPPPADALRVAVTPELGGVPVDPDTQRTLRETVRALKTAGTTVEREPAPVDLDAALTTWADIQGAELSAGMPGPLRLQPGKALLWYGAVRSVFGFLGRRLARGAHRSMRGYLRALDRKAALTRTLDSFFGSWDLWITPVASVPAFSHRRTGAPFSLGGVSVPYALPFAVYNCATAVLGHPILTLPAGRSEEGLPIGLQVHGRPGHDAALLAAGRRLEALLQGPHSPTGPSR